MAKQTRAQQETIGRVMHAFKHGELRTAQGDHPVKDPKQAIAIALHEAGATNQETPAKNRANLRRTKVLERQGKTASASRTSGGRSGEPTKADLYAEAKRRNVPGRASMDKAALRKALGR